MLEKSREGATKGNLGSLKSAASIYYGDLQGIWPATMNSFNVYAFSRYLDNISPVKVTGAFVANVPNPAGKTLAMTGQSQVPMGASAGWLYDSNQGMVYVNSTVKDSKSLPHSFFGFE